MLIPIIIIIVAIAATLYIKIKTHHEYGDEKYLFPEQLQNVVIITLIVSPLLVISVGNLTGYSWVRLQYVDYKEIIEAAIKYRYEYDSLEELKRDYSKFEPEVTYWNYRNIHSDRGLNLFVYKLLGFKQYEVLLPAELVYVNVNGKVLFAERFGSVCPRDVCQSIPPDNSELD